jgi:aminoglycoside 6'-N-acetyltransferase I
MDRPHYLGEPVNIELAQVADAADWAEMRQALWPDTGIEEHTADINSILAAPRSSIGLIARVAEGTAVGFAEASVRHDYVNGCDSSPVVFLEGIYVRPEYRRMGVARQLVDAIESWGRAQGCLEFGSDANIANIQSQSMHRSLGFIETQRVVFYRKILVEK